MSYGSNNNPPPNADGDDIVIVAACRTPLTRSRKGGLVEVPPCELLQTVVHGVCQQSGASPNHIDDVCVGNVLLPPEQYSLLRMACMEAGLPNTCSFATVNRQCASGLQAVAHVAQALRDDSIQMGIAAGVESMSLTNMAKMQPPQQDYSQFQPSSLDCMLPMGITSDTVAQRFHMDRYKLDQFALKSHQKAARAQRDGAFVQEIVPVRTISQDDGIRPQTTLAKLSQLRAVFTPKGVTTAGNSSQTTDGAAAVLLTKRSRAVALQLPILGIWRGFCVTGVPPSIMGIGPAVAIPKVLKQTKLQVSDIDIFEINEAFASQALYCIDKLGLDHDKVNPNGGAISLGHPLGATGARMVSTLLYELHRKKQRYGVVSMCVGTGMGAAAVIEVEPSSRL